jgi:hypothetical protein
MRTCALFTALALLFRARTLKEDGGDTESSHGSCEDARTVGQSSASDGRPEALLEPDDVLEDLSSTRRTLGVRSEFL